MIHGGISLASHCRNDKCSAWVRECDAFRIFFCACLHMRLSLVRTSCACVAASAICIVCFSSCLRLVLEAISGICGPMRCSRKDFPPSGSVVAFGEAKAGAGHVVTRSSDFGEISSRFLFTSPFSIGSRVWEAARRERYRVSWIIFQLEDIDCKPMKYLQFFLPRPYPLLVLFFLAFFLCEGDTNILRAREHKIAFVFGVAVQDRRRGGK